MSIDWKKTLIVACDIVVATYLLLAVTAFNKPDAKDSHCNEVKIDIEQNVYDGFMTADEIKQALNKEHLYPLKQPLTDISPRKIEETLQKNPFVENAEVYKTQSGNVCIQIKQRIPVVRVMADNGENYYLDTHGSMMPESRYVTDLIIATGSINRCHRSDHRNRIDQPQIRQEYTDTRRQSYSVRSILEKPDCSDEYIRRRFYRGRATCWRPYRLSWRTC